MSTVVTYNNVTLNNCQTRRFDEVLAYDKTGTDPLGIRYLVSVVSYIHDQLPSSVQSNSPYLGGFSNLRAGGEGVGLGYATADEIAIRSLLMVPRQDFKMSINGVPILYVTPARDNDTGSAYSQGQGGLTSPPVQYDINNGPKPLSCNVTQIVGTGVYRVEFVIEITVSDCEKQSEWLANRWSLTESVDSNQYLTRTIAGKIRVRSVDDNPQKFRNLCIPKALQAGFKRQGMTFVTSADGLEMDYSITDIQIYAAAPQPATDWKCVHRLYTPDGVASFASIDILMQGKPDINKRALIAMCLSIMQQKLLIGGNGALPDGTWYLQSVEIVDNVNDSTVSLSATVQYMFGVLQAMAGKPVNVVNKASAQVINVLGNYIQKDNTIGVYDPLVNYKPINYPDGSMWNNFICYLQDQCKSTLPPSIDSVSATSGTPRSPGSRYGAPVTNTPVSTPSGTIYDDSGNAGNSESTPPKPVTYSSDQKSVPVDDMMFGSVNVNNYNDYSQDNADGAYSSYQIDSRYVNDQIRAHCPVAIDQRQSGQTPSVVINLGPTLAKRLIRIRGTRKGKAPKLLKHTSYSEGNGITATPIGTAQVNMPAPVLSVDGGYVYTAHAEYVFALSGVPSTDNLRPASLPWDTGTVDQNTTTFKDAFNDPLTSGLV